MATIRSPGFLPEPVAALLFESHLWAWIVMLAVAGPILVLGYKRNQRSLMIPARIVLVVILAWVLAANVVTTPGERLAAAHGRILKAASEGDAGTIQGLLHEQFRFQTVDRPMMSAIVGVAVKAAAPKSNTERFYQAKMTVGPSDGQLYADSLINVITTLSDKTALGLPPGPYLTKWHLYWVDVPGGDWKLLEIRRAAVSQGPEDTDQELRPDLGMRL